MNHETKGAVTLPGDAPQTASIFQRAALTYATRFGFSVLPCLARDKKPLTSHGCKDATRDVGTISMWWRRWPDANVGIACGVSSGGLLVLDVDGEAGLESLSQLENVHGEILKTPQTITGKGLQYYFKSSETFKNKVRMMPGLDLRTDGGYVIAPPSIHPNGKRYSWELSARIDEIAMADPPDWLLKIISEPKVATHVSIDWAGIALKCVPYGARNQTLASVAGHLFRVGVDPKLAYTLLAAWNDRCVEPPLGMDEFDRTVNSIAMAECARKKRAIQC